jgi:hypothetical protein
MEMNRRAAMSAEKKIRNQKDRRKTESWPDRIMQREEKPEPMRMILSGHDSVFRCSSGPADFLAACEQF